ncbi:Crp/Fnr family transcriptional regulator [uncultured Chitinophaga sp.]|uniref:Crp/Fnr family transcriptional regulator n=1 Tax=uncultured Chitinophaga sp. TaxID=339340 RepID=UPI0025E23B7E|nr:Crp/Fnr family transcriptional regulator [uncultured Chitinophaga sp.]
MDIDKLRPAIYAVVDLPPQQWEEMAACWEPVQFKRKEVITAAGEVERYAYFVLEGVQRAFFLEGDKDATLVFNYTGSFSGVIDSFFLQQPSRYYLETLTACRCLRLSFADLTRLMDKYPLIERWVRIGTTAALSGVMERHIEMLTSNAEQKFRKLLTRSPHVLQIIPHKYLASYLGIDPATFSKLMGSVRL